jgi:hypothetical protein
LQKNKLLSEFRFFVFIDAESETVAKKSRSLFSQIFFVWFDFFIIKGKEGSLKGTSDFAPDSENRLT